MHQPGCIFCEIVAGREVSSKVYEDERILAFMNIRPVNSGEFLIIPKEHIDHFVDIPDDLAAHIFLTGQRLSRDAQVKLRPTRMGYVVHGFGVAHAHLNVVPLEHPDDIVSRKFTRLVDGKLDFDAGWMPPVPREELDRMAEIIRGVK